MDIQQQISRQRVKHILSSYQIDQGALEEPTSDFSLYLEEMLKTYPLPLVELALAETLVDQWVVIPMTRALPFLRLAHHKLKSWEHEPIISTLTPAQFQQITGLSPVPVFGASELPPSQPLLRP